MKVEIYGASWCTTCQQVIDYCKNNSISYEYQDVDDSGTLKALESRLGNRVRSVPQIFVDNQHLTGGFNELRQKNSSIVQGK